MPPARDVIGQVQGESRAYPGTVIRQGIDRLSADILVPGNTLELYMVV